MSWTPERRLKQSQLIHKWKPWKQSTGARTEEGKAISKMNAYKHGGSNLQIRLMKNLLKKLKSSFSE